jgi:hypothetical protein
MATKVSYIHLGGPVDADTLAGINSGLDELLPGEVIVTDGNIYLEYGNEDTLRPLLEYLQERSIPYLYGGYDSITDVHFMKRWTPQHGEQSIPVDDEGEEVVYLYALISILNALEERAYTKAEIVELFADVLDVDIPPYEAVPALPDGATA